MYGITITVFRSALKLVEIYVNLNRTSLALYKRPPMTFTQRFLSTITFVLSRAALFLGNGDFHNCPKGNVSHLCWSHSALGCHCIQITISNQSGNPANNIWPVTIENVVRFPGRGLSQREISRRYRVLEGAISKILRHVRAYISLTKGTTTPVSYL